MLKKTPEKTSKINRNISNKKSTFVDFLFSYINNIYVMKKETKLSELRATLLLALIISGVIILLSTIGIFFGQFGWLIGALIGTGVEVLYIYLVNFGSSLALKESKSGLFLLTYFLRIISFVGVFALLVILQYIVDVKFLYYSCWGMLIAFAPSTFITIAVQLMHKEKNNG